mmetsp:Transcript_77899/g.158256  ORF Transcript_77899/g.158256 Transcript_77899/m.158256 type:complete len:290 (-) Transcript_77899:160-1029(-)
MKIATTLLFFVVLSTHDAFTYAFTTNSVGGSLPFSGMDRVCTTMEMTTEEQEESTYVPPPNVVSNDALAEAHNFPAIILSPNLEAAAPDYFEKAPVGGGKDGFIVSKEGGPTPEELTNENLIRIVNRRSNVTDIEVNTLVWKCLGYRFDPETEKWSSPEVFPKWKERYPTPPDVIGMRRQYAKDIDGEQFRNSQQLTKSIPVEHKQMLRQFLRPMGFRGYKVSELTPNLTRRAQATNWLLFYREELYGYTLEELIAKRQIKRDKEAEEEQRRIEANEEKPFDYPLKEVF